MRSQLPSPIIIFNVKEFGINQEEFIDESSLAFNDLSWDYYDLRRLQLAFLSKNIDTDIFNKIPKQLLIDYYLGQAELKNFNFILNKFTEKQLLEFKKIKAYRKRSIAEFILTCASDAWSMKRIPISKFVQVDAKIDSANTLDFRLFPRIFLETKEDAIKHSFFKKLLSGIASRIQTYIKNIKKMRIVAHHTYVEATQKQPGNNSPEGVHQDGCHYVVPAIVVERKNIAGAVSRIFGVDKKTCLLSTELIPGLGILHPDKGTDLWHDLTPFYVMPGHEHGYRTSIGFDIHIC